MRRASIATRQRDASTVRLPFFIRPALSPATLAQLTAPPA